jgi:SOS response associated peptidase (SRAP)
VRPVCQASSHDILRYRPMTVASSAGQPSPETRSRNLCLARICDRMLAILRPEDYERWLGPEPDPHDVLQPFPAEPMIMWPVSSRVNSPMNDDAELLRELQFDQLAS